VTTAELAGLDLQKANTDLNNKEYLERKTVLESTPQRIFMQINAICNADCVFCSKGYDYPTFSLDDYLKVGGPEMSPIIARARELVLTGSGEFLGLPDAERILTYFNTEFPHTDKYIATNASHARPKIWDLISQPGSKYTLQLSLHSTDRESHELMMRYGAYDQVMKNLDFLLNARAKHGSPKINLMFIMTTLNAEKLPEFIRWGTKLGVDKIIAGYFYIYESQQKYLSLYFKQELANKVVDEARIAAKEAKCEVVLPPKFGDSPAAYVRPDVCPEPWHQIMINADGRVLPCDVYGNFNEDLNGKSFKDIWNGEAYQQIRANLAKNTGCITTCPRQNVSAINDWKSHVIQRHKDDKQIVKEYYEALRKP
jgi:MoaA/NifB/PqqE/SkfB family radical SAM enzyme